MLVRSAYVATCVADSFLGGLDREICSRGTRVHRQLTTAQYTIEGELLFAECAVKLWREFSREAAAGRALGNGVSDPRIKA
jgi:hypothetical protein